MSDRLEARQQTRNTDIPQIANFAGLSSASTNVTGELVYQDKLINTLVTKSGEMKQRTGSTGKTSFIWVSGAKAFDVFAFKFDGIDYRLIRVGDQLALFTVENYTLVANKGFVLRTASYDEKATYAVSIEGEYCHVFVATASTQLIVLTIMSRSATIAKTGNTLTFTIERYPTFNPINDTNTIVYNQSNALIPVVTCSQSSGTITYASSNANSVATGDTIKMHSVFWMRACDANYYPGLYLYNTAVRRNSVALDVNVQLPTEIVSNPIFNEPQLQDISVQTTVLFKNNSASAFAYTKVTNNQPTTEDSWDFSDGAYRVDPNIYTVRSPAYASFGALATGGAISRVFCCRLRKVLLNNSVPIQRQYCKIFYDRALAALPTYYDQGVTTYLNNPTDLVYYFSVTNYNPATSQNVNPGVSLSSVVELVNTGQQAGTNSNSVVFCDLTGTSNTISLFDGCVLPFYGYNAIANIKQNKYPNIVAVVGNRLILTGYNNQIAVSDSDWTYRGVSFNNLQSSIIDFNASSSYYVRLAQGASIVKGIASVNGVLIAATDVGLYRISGNGTTTPPDAVTANVSRISSEIVNSSSCFTVYDNKLFYASSNGFYQLEYAQQTNELVNKSISSQVSDYFSKYIAKTVTYSRQLRAFLITFTGTNDILTYYVDSDVWSTIRLSTPLAPEINQTFDGYVLKTTETGGSDLILLAEWSNDTTDIANLGNWTTAILPPLSVNVTSSDTDISALVTPAEFISLLNANVVQGAGDNTARVIGSDNATIVEHGGGLIPLPILSYSVPKAYISDKFKDKLGNSSRLRSVDVIVKGTGNLTVVSNFPYADYSESKRTIYNYTIGTPLTYAGEPMLNAQFSKIASKGETQNLRVRFTGISEAWGVAFKFGVGLSLVGLQIDSATKGTRRLR